MVTPVTSTASGAMEIKTSMDRARMTREDFVEILMAELSQQNPMDPVDNSTFLSQLVDLQGLETSASLADGLKSFRQFIEMSSASGLIGKWVKGKTDAGADVQGVVEKVQMDEKGVRLVVGQQKVSLEGVQEILNNG